MDGASSNVTTVVTMSGALPHYPCMLSPGVIYPLMAASPESSVDSGASL